MDGIPSIYKHLLYATDFSEYCEINLWKVKQLASHFNATVSLLHIVEAVPLDITSEFSLPYQLDLETELLEQARKRLLALGEKFAIPLANCHAEIGTPKTAIIDFARRANVDLIIIGSHIKHGLAKLFGSTSDGVLKDTYCDMLAIRSP